MIRPFSPGSFERLNQGDLLLDGERAVASVSYRICTSRLVLQDGLAPDEIGFEAVGDSCEVAIEGRRANGAGGPRPSWATSRFS